MKRSEINRALKEMEAMERSTSLQFRRSVILRRKNGRKKAMNMTKSEKICWAGTLRIMDWADLTRWDFL